MYFVLSECVILDRSGYVVETLSTRLSCKRGLFLACIQTEFVIIWRKLNGDFTRKRIACAFSTVVPGIQETFPDSVARLPGITHASPFSSLDEKTHNENCFSVKAAFCLDSSIYQATEGYISISKRDIEIIIKQLLIIISGLVSKLTQNQN